MRMFVHRFRLRLAIALTVVFAHFGGCVPVQETVYPNRLIGADGQLFTVDDLEEIANDADLTEDEKREQFRELGIEDEKLIDALLEL